MTGSTSQREPPSDTMSVCLASCNLPSEKQNPHWPIINSDSSSGAAARVPSLDNVEMVLEEPEAMQLNPGGST